MLSAIKERLSEFSVLKEILPSYATAFSGESKNIHKKIRLTQIEEEIEDLLSKVSETSDVLIKYIDQKVSALDTERKTLLEEIATANATGTENKIKQITNHVTAWETLSFEGRQAVADTLIEVIRIADGSMKIIWNI